MSTKVSIDSLTGLRGIAAMLVVCSHYFMWTAPYSVASAPDQLKILFSTSNYGMTLFFTLSGFVITYNYLNFGWDRTPFSSFFRFAYLRFSRLYPALLIFILALMILKASSSVPVVGLRDWTFLHLVNAETWMPTKWNGALPIDNVFHISWSISTEFMLYFMFAAVVILGSQAGRLAGASGRLAVMLIAACYVVFVLALVYSRSFFDEFFASLYVPFEPLTVSESRRWFFYLSPYFRILEFGMGCYAALLVMNCQVTMSRHRTKFRLLAALAVVLLLLLHGRVFFFGLFADDLKPIEVFFANLDSAQWREPAFELLTAFLFSIIMANGNDASRLNAILCSSVLVFLGEISYSLYLFHPLAPRFGYIVPGSSFSWDLVPAHLMNLLISCFFAIVLAYGMYKLVEMPAQRMLRLLFRKRSAA